MKLTDEYILRQPKQYQDIMLYLISVVEQNVTELVLHFKWGIPYFYYKNKPFCYLAPNHKNGFVDIGFAKGYQLKMNQDYLIGEKRNTVKSLRYYDLNSIENHILESVIEEAIQLYV